MQFVRLVYFCALFLNNKIFLKCFEELFFTQSVQVAHNAVVVDDIELVIRETNGKEIVVFLVTRVIRIL